MSDKPGDALTDQEILDVLNGWHTAGLFDYVLPTEPLGEQWVIGSDGQILKMKGKEQILAFIAGCNCALRTFAERAGMRL